MKADPVGGGAAVAAAEVPLAVCLREIRALSELLRHEEQKNAKLVEELAWLVKVNERIAARPVWWSILPRAARRERELKLLQRAGLFDAAGYLERHPDVAATGMNPLRHYLNHGFSEGRSRVDRKFD